VQNLPGGVPVSDCFCADHVPANALKPLPILLLITLLAALLVVVWVLR
jgi:hypothetical protein